MTPTKNHNLPLLLLVCCNVLFLALYSILCFHNRLAADDFYFLANLNEHGAINGTIAEFNSWSSRYTSVFLLHSVLALHKQNDATLMLFGFLNLILLTTAIKCVLQRLMARYLTKQLPGSFLQWNLALFTVFALFQSTVQIDETWFWLCASCTYLWSIIMLLFAFNWIIHPSPRIGTSLIGIFACIYLGGALGPLALLCIVLLLVYIVYSQYFASRAKAITRPVIALSLISIAFLILWSAEGNTHREAFFGSIGIAESLWTNTLITGYVFLKKVLFILPQLLLFTSPLLFISGIKPLPLLKESKLKSGLLIMLLLGLLVFAYLWPISYKTQGIPALRALAPVTFLLVFGIGYLFLLLRRTVIKLKTRLALTAIPLLIISMLTIAGIKRQYALVCTYAKAYDQRMTKLESFRNIDGLIFLEPLPPSGLIYSAEISTDADYHSNRHLMNGLGIDAQVAIASSAAE